MGHYLSNLRDLQFNLFEVLGSDTVLGTGPFKDLDGDTAREVLLEVDRLAREVLAEPFVDSDRHPPTFDPRTFTAATGERFKAAYDAWMAAEFWRLQLDEELGGTLAPSVMNWALAELVLGANPGIWMYAVGTTFAKLIHHNGNARDRLLAQHIVDRRWGCTMVLTEPDAGSDVGAARAKATPNPDGSWHVTGVKRFITSGESDLQDNIIHLVLARPQGVPGAGGAGTKGLSLFWMPKYHFDPQTGELTGERNGIYATNIEHKMGLKVSNTCELTFGDPQVGGGEPAKGWLLGEAHDGIAQMFDVIEYARMMVGTKAVATLSTGYLNALAYAKERVQGADLTRSSDKTAPRVTITHHPDVRRSLLTQKAAVDGMRALVLYTASWQDRVAMAAHEGDNAADRALAGAVNDLLLPIVKGYGSERSWVLLGTESLQTLGGSGFLSDFPIEQYVRDAKIDTLYEGTTAIQGQDLFFRKIVKNRGQALQHLLGEVSEFAGRVDVGLNRERELLAVALADTQAIVTRMLDDLSAAAEGNERNIYKVGLNTSRLLMVLGDLICAWLLLRQAEVALAGLDRDPSPSDVAFYRGKVTAASWFAHQQLPGVSAERAIVEETDLSAMDLDELSL